MSYYGWIHRQCAGLSDPFFRVFSGNDTPFLCVICMLKTQSEEITNLKATIDDLKNSIANLTSKNQPLRMVKTNTFSPWYVRDKTDFKFNINMTFSQII